MRWVGAGGRVFRPVRSSCMGSVYWIVGGCFRQSPRHRVPKNPSTPCCCFLRRYEPSQVPRVSRSALRHRTLSPCGLPCISPESFAPSLPTSIGKNHSLNQTSPPRPPRRLQAPRRGRDGGAPVPQQRAGRRLIPKPATRRSVGWRSGGGQERLCRCWCR